MAVYALVGRRVATLVNEAMARGTKTPSAVVSQFLWGVDINKGLGAI